MDISLPIKYIRELKNNKFKDILDFNTDIFQTDIEHFIGAALAHNNIIAISLINLYIREHHIEINKRRTSKIIYNYSCGAHHMKYAPKGCYISYARYNENDYYKYADLYRKKLKS